MAQDGNAAHDESNAARHHKHSAEPVGLDAAHESVPGQAGELVSQSAALLGDARLEGRGNQGVKTAVIQSMQRTYGNRALQRHLNRLAPKPAATETEVVMPLLTTTEQAVPGQAFASPAQVQRHAAHEDAEQPVQTMRADGAPVSALPMQRHPAGAGLSIDAGSAVANIQNPPASAATGTGGRATSPAIEPDGGAPPGGTGTTAPPGPTPAGPTPAGPTPAGPTPAGPTPTPEGGAATPEAPVAAPIPPESMSLSRAQEVLTQSFGTVHTIVPGNIQILDGRAALYAAYDRINLGRNNTYASPARPWQNGDAQQYIPGLEGFADTSSGTVYINKNSVLPTVTTHEMLHMNTAPDFRAAVGETINEGTTEHLAKKAMTAAGVSTVGFEGAEAYPRQQEFTRKLIDVVGESVLIQAYFNGSATLIRTYEMFYGPGMWSMLKVFLEAQQMDLAEPWLKPPSAQTRIDMINSLLDGWVTDKNLDDIERIVMGSGGDKTAISAAILPRSFSLWSARQRTRLIRILT